MPSIKKGHCSSKYQWFNIWNLLILYGCLLVHEACITQTWSEICASVTWFSNNPLPHWCPFTNRSGGNNSNNIYIRKQHFQDCEKSKSFEYKCTCVLYYVSNQRLQLFILRQNIAFFYYFHKKPMFCVSIKNYTLRFGGL